MGEGLASFNNCGVKLHPDTIYDSHGALAGSAFVVDGTVNIAYTGAHMTESGRIIPNQLRAVLNEHFRVRREPRSEEHTSELQSRFDLVCRLLLEKKEDI